MLVPCQARSPWKTGLQKGRAHKRRFKIPVPCCPKSSLSICIQAKKIQPCRVGHQISSRTSPGGHPLSKKTLTHIAIRAQHNPLRVRHSFPRCDPITNHVSGWFTVTRVGRVSWFFPEGTRRSQFPQPEDTEDPPAALRGWLSLRSWLSLRWPQQVRW